MKTAVSIPDKIFEEAEHMVERLQTSRSQLYARALAEFLARHAEDRVTTAMNQVIDDVGTETDDFSHKAARQVLEKVDW